MALTNYYMSLASAADEVALRDDLIVQGTSSTSTNHVELRMMVNDGSVVTNLTRLRVIKALEQFIRTLKQGGGSFSGANLPSL